jgi:hypothetical protein
VAIQTQIIVQPTPEPHVGFSFTVTTGTGDLFPDPAVYGTYLVVVQDAIGSNLSWPGEVFQVINRIDDTFTFLRMQQGTDRRFIHVGDVVTLLQHTEEFHIKVSSDTAVLTGGAGQFIFAIPPDLNGAFLLTAAGYLSTPGTGDTLVSVNNVTTSNEVLTSEIQIDGGTTTSYTSAVPVVVNFGNSEVHTGDLLSIDVDTAGGGAMGLGVILSFIVML